MNFVRFALAGLMVCSFGAPAGAHIDLLSPAPLLHGKAGDRRALKVPPFGAPGVDVAAAPATEVKSGSVIDVDIEMYVYHPGEIVFLWTRDFTGADVEPAYEIPSMDTPIPHHNLLQEIKTRPRGSDPMYHAQVQLPDVEGDIILVVRQVMHDKFDVNADGSVGLTRIYYHQAAKLRLVK